MATLEELEKRKKTLKLEKERYHNLKDNVGDKVDQGKKRRKKLESLLNDLKWDFDGNVRKINRHVNDINSNLEEAIKGANTVQAVFNVIESDNERDAESDSDLKVAMDELAQEIRELETYEQQLKNQKLDYGRRISNIDSQLFDINHEISKMKLMGKK